MLKRIDHIGVVVDDLEEARRFLEGKLGLDLVRTGEAPTVGRRFAFYRCGDCQIELIEELDPAAREGSAGPGGATIEHIAIQVDDLDGAIAALEGVGVRFRDRPVQVGANLNVWTLPESCDGVMYQLLAPTPR
jgi:methylmalonyl-CoA/ethylmalonyl-CoA epimerase